MSSPFTKRTFTFLSELAENNDRKWFHANQDRYETDVRQPALDFIDEFAERLVKISPHFVADSRKVGGSLFRIQRDTRFAKDKTPYKTHLGASFPWMETEEGTEAGGYHDERTHGNGGYFHFQPGEMYVGGGMWQMEKPRIEAFQAAVRDEPDRVRAALEAPAFAAWFGAPHAHEELKRVPRGYPQEHPLADMFRWKDVVFGRRLADDEVLSPDLPDRLAEGFATAAPVFRFLDGLTAA